jgi:protein-tyrosine phosphatase
VTRRWTPQSAVNFRDVGGRPTAGGGSIRPGELFRSESPQFLTKADAVRLVDSAGLRLVLDLRFADEAAAAGRGPLADTGVRYLNIPIVGAGGDDIAFAIPLDGDGNLLTRYYISFVQRNPQAFVDVCRALASSEGLPALLHCAAGKDRTGAVVAVLLSALGVPDDAVVADYARTTTAMPAVLRRLASVPAYASTMGAEDPADEKVLSTPETMQGFLTWLQREHGSARQMLLSAGLEPDVLARLAHLLVERAAA